MPILVISTTIFDAHLRMFNNVDLAGFATGMVIANTVNKWWREECH